jgi:predicted GNAT family N-acyltransferase
MAERARSIEIREISARDTHPLRQRVLRPNQPPEAMFYPGDETAGALHLGAFDDRQQLVGIASLSIEPPPFDGPARMFRLRGMAVEPELQGSGIGAKLVQTCIARASEAGLAGIWCNARITAEPFYRRLGFTVVGERFDIDGIGPHVVMWRDLA